MRRFEFALESVLRYRRQRERMAELQEMQARAALATATRVLAEREETIARLGEEMAREVGHAAPVAEWAGRFERSAQAAQMLRLAEVELEVRERDLREAIRERARLGTEVEALAVLRREAWQAHRYEAARREQALRDERALPRQRTERGGGP